MSQELYRTLLDISKDSLKHAVTERYKGDANLLTIKESRNREHKFGPETLLLTLSAHAFRAIYTLSFEQSDGLKKYFESCQSRSSDNTGTSQQDFLFELLNVYVGDVKRHMQVRIPGLGISTPNILKSDAMNYTDAIKIDWSAAFTAEQHGTPLFFASLYVSIYGPVTLEEAQQEESQSAGELEFF